MEKALQVPSCLFGGPPERDNMIKLGQSQTGFIKVFAKPLFDAVADILPGMQFAVDEMITNTSTWEKRIQDTIEKNARAHGLNSDLRFGSDALSSPASEPALVKSPLLDGKQYSDPKTQSNSELSTTGSTPTPDKSSSVPGARSPPTIPEAQTQDRRGSGDASLTTILVTPTAQLSEPGSEMGRKKPCDDAGTGNGNIRPLTAPSHARHSNGEFPRSRTLQCTEDAQDYSHVSVLTSMQPIICTLSLAHRRATLMLIFLRWLMAMQMVAALTNGVRQKQVLTAT